MDLKRLNELGAAMEESPPKGVKGLFYSDSGNGKSHLCYEVADRVTPKNKFWLLIDTSDNYTIMDQINDGAGPRKNWRRLPFTFLEDLETIAEAIATGQPGWSDVGTVVLDEASIMAQQDVDRIFEAKNKDYMIETPGWDEYRPGLLRFRRMLGKFMAITGLNLLMVAHEKGPVKDLSKQHADFPIATYKSVKKALTFVGRVVADEKTPPGSTEAVYERIIQVHPTKAYDAKCRLGTEMVKMPTAWFPDLVEQWAESNTPDNSNTKGQPEEDDREDDKTPTPPSSEFEEIDDYNVEDLEVKYP